MSFDHLPPEQAERAEQIYQRLRSQGDAKLRQIAELLASKPDHQLLGQTEFEVRDLVHQLGSDGIEAALEGRKKGGTEGPA